MVEERNGSWGVVGVVLAGVLGFRVYLVCSLCVQDCEMYFGSAVWQVVC